MRFERSDRVRFCKSGRSFLVPYGSEGVVLDANEYNSGVMFYTVRFEVGTFTVEAEHIQSVDYTIPLQAILNLCLAFWSASQAAGHRAIKVHNIEITDSKLKILGDDGKEVLLEYNLS